MKKNLLNKSKSLAFTLFFVLVVSSLNAATYSTLSNGDWNDMSNVWSLDGSTPCGCQPGATTNGNTIVLRHQINMTSNIFVNDGTVFTVEAVGGLSGNNNITVNESEVNIYGPVSFAKFVINSTGTVNLTGALLTLTNRLIVEGVLNIDGGYVAMSGGNVNVYEYGTLNTTNAGKVDVYGGNINNEGLVNICSTCCMTTKGNWNNSGTVTGDGSATSTNGNMSNVGSWSPSIVWCSVGFDTGMTSQENCTDANSTCGLVVLPVELSKFDVELVGNSRISVTWETSSEKNSDYFAVLKSTDGIDWLEVETVEAAGNSTSLNSYSVLDYNSNFNIAYYRLLQVDIDGSQKFSDVKVVSGKELVEISVFPNPTKLGEVKSVAVINVENASISIVDLNGRVIYSAFSEKNTAVISLIDFQSGMYFIQVLTEEGRFNSYELVVME